jgi:hypothetical protein
LTSLDDVKTTQTDSNAAKTMALDHLGVIAARIRSSMLKFQPKDDSAPKSKPLMPMDEVCGAFRFDTNNSDYFCDSSSPVSMRNGSTGFWPLTRTSRCTLRSALRKSRHTMYVIPPRATHCAA